MEITMTDRPTTEMAEEPPNVLTDEEWYDQFGDCISTALDVTAAQRWVAQGGQGDEGELTASDRTHDNVGSAAVKLRAKDYSPAHEVLANQALVLDEIFSQFTGMAAKDPIDFKTCMAIALRAQSQCRWTFRALATLSTKSPAGGEGALAAAGPGQLENICGQTIGNGKIIA